MAKRKETETAIPETATAQTETPNQTEATTVTPETQAAPTPAASTEEKKRGKWATKDTSQYPWVVFKWSDGTVFTLDVTTFTEADIKAATLHGFSQKLGDSYSGITSLEIAKAKFDKQLSTIREKGFTSRVEGEIEEPAELLAQAITAALTDAKKNPDYPKILEQVKASDRKQRNQWKSVDTVAMHLARLRKHTEAPNLDAFGY